MTESDETTLHALLAELKAAVAAGDRARAMEVRQWILQRLAAKDAAGDRIEQEVNVLLADLDENEGRRLRQEREQRALQELQQRQQQQQQQQDISRSWPPPGQQQQQQQQQQEIPRSWPSSGQQQQQQQQQYPFESGYGFGPQVAAAGSGGTATGVDFPVWFGTNRKPLAGGKSFGYERSVETTLGQMWVHVPKGHRYGEVASSFWQKLWRLNFEDDALKVVGIERQPADKFYAGLQAVMQEARASGAKPQAVVFLHGFNVEFDEAAIRAAQIGYDLGVPGATAFFSWPSQGKVRAYAADEATIEASEQAIANFLIDFTAKCGAETVHVIAHSMGNRGLLRALQRIAGDAQSRGKVKFGQIILAAPDVDRDVFLDLAHVYRAFGARTTLYCSDGDKAVFASSVLHDAPRAGYFQPYTIADGVDTIAVPNFNVELLGHGYFAAAEPLLYDIGGLLKHDSAPPRQRMDPANDGGKVYWSLRK